MLACPRYALSAFTFTPAAMKMLAQVCLASWRPIGLRSALPRLQCSGNQAVAVERLLALAEEETAGIATAEDVGGKVNAERRNNRDGAIARATLRLDHALVFVPGPLHADHSGLEVHVILRGAREALRDADQRGEQSPRRRGRARPQWLRAGRQPQSGRRSARVGRALRAASVRMSG
jgi:hypothetical protein